MCVRCMSELNNNKWNQKQDNASEFNESLGKIAQDFTTLFKTRMESKLQHMKDGARTIAASSDNPELHKVCDDLDKITIN